MGFLLWVSLRSTIRRNSAGDIIMALNTAIEEMKTKQGITESVKSVRDAFDNIVDALIDSGYHLDVQRIKALRIIPLIAGPLSEFRHQPFNNLR